jgi:hypothetical protein
MKEQEINPACIKPIFYSWRKADAEDWRISNEIGFSAMLQAQM